MTVLGLLSALDDLLTFRALDLKLIGEVLPDLNGLIKLVDDQIPRHDCDDNCLAERVRSLRDRHSELPLLHVLGVPVLQSEGSRQPYSLNIDRLALFVVFDVEAESLVVHVTHQEVIGL